MTQTLRALNPISVTSLILPFMSLPLPLLRMRTLSSFFGKVLHIRFFIWLPRRRSPSSGLTTTMTGFPGSSYSLNLLAMIYLSYVADSPFTSPKRPRQISPVPSLLQLSPPATVLRFCLLLLPLWTFRLLPHLLKPLPCLVFLPTLVL